MAGAKIGGKDKVTVVLDGPMRIEVHERMGRRRAVLLRDGVPVLVSKLPPRYDAEDISDPDTRPTPRQTPAARKTGKF